MRRAARGFTLLEVLVVLVISSLVAGLLSGSLSQVMRLQQHFGSETFNLQQGAMQSAWFRQTIHGLMPEPPEGRHHFKGEARRCEGITLSPLDLAEGTLAAFEWSLRFDREAGETVLEYGNGSERQRIMAWPGDGGAFEYLDRDGGSHEAWPPFLGQWPQLPAAVRLRIPDPAGGRVIEAAPRGPTTPPPRLKDAEA